MSDFPKSISINEEGPREGFQIEAGPITTARKIELIDALSDTGLKHIQIVSFVNPKKVPGMADAEDVVRGITRKDGVDYTAVWLNDKGLERAISMPELHVEGRMSMCASEKFLMRNQNKTMEGQAEFNHRALDRYKELGLPVRKASIMCAFGCNFEGDIPLSRILSIFDQTLEIAEEHGVKLEVLGLSDTMAWATPQTVKRAVGAVRERYPDHRINIHLHDTRGMAIANAYAALEMGVDMFDACVAGLGGCPFAGHKGAAGNVCTEDLVMMCEEMGIETGIDLDRLIECAELAEDIVGHPLPGSVMKGGTLAKLRSRAH